MKLPPLYPTAVYMFAVCISLLQVAGNGGREALHGFATGEDWVSLWAFKKLESHSSARCYCSGNLLAYTTVVPSFCDRLEQT